MTDTPLTSNLDAQSIAIVKATLAMQAATELQKDILDTDEEGHQSFVRAFDVTKKDREQVVAYSLDPSDYGHPHFITRNMLPAILATGKFWVHETQGPKPMPVVGAIKCYLHPEHEDRAWLDSIGLTGRTCDMGDLTHRQPPRGDFKSGWDRDQHMARKHRQEWAMVKDSIDRRDRERNEAFQRALLETIAASRVPDSDLPGKVVKRAT